MRELIEVIYIFEDDDEEERLSCTLEVKDGPLERERAVEFIEAFLQQVFAGGINLQTRAYSDRTEKELE
jgi:hypothetical protein